MCVNYGFRIDASVAHKTFFIALPKIIVISELRLISDTEFYTPTIISSYVFIPYLPSPLYKYSSSSFL